MNKQRQDFFNFLTHAIAYVNCCEKMTGSTTIPEYDARTKASLCLEGFNFRSDNEVLDTIREIREIFRS